MKLQKRSKRSLTFQLSQHSQTSPMQNNFFSNENNIQNGDKLLQFQLSDKQTPIIPHLEEQDYSNNVLNTGFIAEDSKFVSSDSQSVVSDGFSISGISVIRSNSKGSPHIMNNFDQEISGLSGIDEWSQTSQISLTTKNFKRNKPEAIEAECLQMQNQYTKRKMNEKNKVVTLNHRNTALQHQGYRLRSKSKQKVVDEQSSSNQDIREILVNMQEKNPNSSKNKSRGK